MTFDSFRIFDRLVFGSILNKATDEDVESIRLAAAHDRADSDHRDFIYRMLDALDNKTAALLTHISLIIAALTFIYSSQLSQSRAYKFFLISEICIYLLLTVFCLRAIRMMSRLSLGKSSLESSALDEEFLKRLAVYDAASSSTILVTLLTLLTIMLGALFG